MAKEIKTKCDRCGAETPYARVLGYHLDIVYPMEDSVTRCGDYFCHGDLCDPCADEIVKLWATKKDKPSTLRS